MILSNKATYAFFDKPISSFQILPNKIAYLTTNQLCIITLSDRPRKQILSIGNREIVSFLMNKNQYLAIIYFSWTLEIRQTGFGKMADVLYKFAGLACKQAIQYPKIRWDNMEVYLVYNHKIQIFNIQKKQRKEYNQILSHEQTKNQQIFDVCASRLIDKQRVVAVQLKKKLIFSFVPIPVTQLQVESVIQILLLSPQTKQSGFPREYLAVVTSQKLIKFYNFINMKQIYQMNYNAKLKKGQKIKIFTDPLKQYIHVCVHQSKNQKNQSLKPIKNYILKINIDYYYRKTFQYFEQEEPFIKWQSQIPLKQELGLHSFKISYIEGLSLLINLISFGEGQINMLTYELDPRVVKFPTHGKWQDKQWKQLKQWKDIITSYMQLNDDFIFGRNQVKQKQKSQQMKQRELKQYENIKSQFDCMMKKFTQTFDMRQMIEQNIHQEDPQVKIEEEWTKYFQKYLIDNNFHLNPQGLQRIEDQSESSDQQQQSLDIITLKRLRDSIRYNNQQRAIQISMQRQKQKQKQKHSERPNQKELKNRGANNQTKIIFDLQSTLKSYNEKGQIEREIQYQKQRQLNLKNIVEQRQKLRKKLEKQKKQREYLQKEVIKKRRIAELQLQPIIQQQMRAYELVKHQFKGDFTDYLREQYRQIQMSQQKSKQIQKEKQVESHLKRTKEKIALKQEEYAKAQQKQMEQENQRLAKVFRNTSSKQMGILPARIASKENLTNKEDEKDKKDKKDKKDGKDGKDEKDLPKINTEIESSFQGNKSKSNKALSLSKQVQFSKVESVNKSDFSCQVQQVQLLFLKQQESGNDFFKDQPQFCKKVRHIQKSIYKGFKPFQEKLSILQNALDRIEKVHLYKLKKCQHVLQATQVQNENIDTTIKSYFRQMLSQITIGIKQNLVQFHQKAEQSNEKVVNQRKETVKLFESYIDEQIKHRSEIFESSRNTIQNHLVKIRRKIISGQFNQAIKNRQTKNGVPTCKNPNKNFVSDFDSSQFESQNQYIQRLLNQNEQV